MLKSTLIISLLLLSWPIFQHVFRSIGRVRFEPNVFRSWGERTGAAPIKRLENKLSLPT